MAKLVEMTHYLECLKTDKGIIFGIQRLLQSIKKKKIANPTGKWKKGTNGQPKRFKHDEEKLKTHLKS